MLVGSCQCIRYIDLELGAALRFGLVCILLIDGLGLFVGGVIWVKVKVFLFCTEAMNDGFVPDVFGQGYSDDYSLPHLSISKEIK